MRHEVGCHEDSIASVRTSARQTYVAAGLERAHTGGHAWSSCDSRPEQRSPPTVNLRSRCMLVRHLVSLIAFTAACAQFVAPARAQTLRLSRTRRQRAPRCARRFGRGDEPPPRRDDDVPHPECRARRARAPSMLASTLRAPVFHAACDAVQRDTEWRGAGEVSVPFQYPPIPSTARWHGRTELHVLQRHQRRHVSTGTWLRWASHRDHSHRAVVAHRNSDAVGRA